MHGEEKSVLNLKMALTELVLLANNFSLNVARFNVSEVADFQGCKKIKRMD